MGLSKILSCGLSGIDGFIVTVEADLSLGMASFDIVGLPDAAVKESKERIRAAIKHSQSELHRRSIVINLAPAAAKKEGSGFDLPIALAVLRTENSFNEELIQNSVFIGELSLDGTVRPVDGVLPMAISAYRKGIKNIFLAPENAGEAAAVKELSVYPVTSLYDTVDILNGKTKPEKYKPQEPGAEGDALSFSGDFSEVKGQEHIKRAIMAAAGGGHNLLMAGTPGTGKTMIASRIPTILPPLTFEEALDVSRIYSVAGLLKNDSPLVKERPFRQLHHTVSTNGITGGGKNPRPGELSLAHKGVLFLDELPEFKRDALETMRQPLEDGFITITRVAGTSVYPCNIMMVASMNPCPCGYFGSDIRECTCTPQRRKKYVRKISGPLLDRIDIQVEVSGVEYASLSEKSGGMGSAEMREKVIAARELQRERYKGLDFSLNSEIPAGLLDEFCHLGSEENAMMEAAYNSLGLSARAHSRILKVARSCADLDGEKEITVSHLAEAIQYRSIDKKYF